VFLDILVSWYLPNAIIDMVIFVTLKINHYSTIYPHTLALINLLNPNPLDFFSSLLLGLGLPCRDPDSDAGDASRCLRRDSELPVEVKVSLRLRSLRIGVGDEVRVAWACEADDVARLRCCRSTFSDSGVVAAARTGRSGVVVVSG
jgi:hypothetical protein